MLFLGACSTGPGDQADLEETLLLSDALTEEQASCFAEGIFGEYGENDEAIGLISNQTFAELLTEEAEQVEAIEVAAEEDPDSVDSLPMFLIGFEEFYTDLSSSCIS